MTNEIEQGDDGLYTLCVMGVDNASDKELQELFEKFGSVIKLHREKSSLAFVRYGSLDEALNCYEKMQNSQFRVRPGRKKGNSNNSEYKRNSASFENSYRTGEMSRRSNGGGDFRGRRSEGGDFNRRSNDGGDFRGRRSEGGDFNRRNNDGGDSRGRRSEGGDFNRKIDGGGDNETVGNMPQLVLNNPAIPVIAQENNNQPPTTAKEVVIGNIPPKMKQHNIYELCSKAKASPMHVAMKVLKRPPYPKMYYAHVYVKTDTDVKNIVQGLNNLIVNGYQLVVRCADKLEEEGKTLLQ